MDISNVDPFVRYAGRFDYTSSGVRVIARDCRLFCFLDGSGEIIIENQHYRIKSGSVFYCNAESVYTLCVPTEYR